MKLRKEWIPYWIGHTHRISSDHENAAVPHLSKTRSRLSPHFIWQDSLPGPALEKQAPRKLSARQGTRSTSAAASPVTRSGRARISVGGTFAANLSRIGEKENYDYLVRWIHNPRQRTRPYCPLREERSGLRKITPKHNLPYVFDLDHSRCPNDGHELLVQQPTIMPSLRLSDADSRDIASYLITQKHADATYAARRLYGRSANGRKKVRTSSATTAAPDATKSAAWKTKAASAPS
jgi:hypothetical protein